MKIIKNIVRKFINSIDIDNFEVETDSGWQKIKSVNKTIKYNIWQLKTEDKSIKAADTHIFFDEHYNEKFLNEFNPGDKIITKNAVEIVTEIKNKNKKANMYDLSVDSIDHRYYSNGFLSHNSTISAIFMVWFIIFNNDKTCAILANKEKTARKLFTDNLLPIFRLLPQWIKPGVYEYNKSSIFIENGSGVITAATTKDGIRGYTINGILWMDEVAFVEDFDEFYASVYPTITAARDSKIIMVSTPRGYNHWYRLWTAAQKGKSEYKPLLVLWNQHPHRDIAWKNREIANTSPENFSQEHDCVIGETLINIKNKKTGEKQTIQMKDLFSEKYK